MILFDLNKNSSLFYKVILPAIICYALCSYQPVLAFDDIIVYRPGNSWWYLSHNPAPYVPGVAPVTSSTNWGNPGNSPLIGDVNGDKLDDIVVTSAATTYNWSAGHTLSVSSLGQIGSQDFPAADSALTGFGTVADNLGNFLADITGNGVDDAITVNTGFNWYCAPSGAGGLGAGGATQGPKQFGQTDDQPVMGDFDGDGYKDIGVYRPAGGTIHWKSSAGGTMGAGGLGPVGQIGYDPCGLLIIGNLNGDQYDDAVMYRMDGEDNIEWWGLINDGTGFLDYFNPGTTLVGFGLDNGGDIPFLADINGDGLDDIGVTRGGVTHYVTYTTANGALGTNGAGDAVWNFGLAGDIHMFGTFDYFKTTKNPYPADKATTIEPDITLLWESPGATGDEYDVYISENDPCFTSVVPVRTSDLFYTPTSLLELATRYYWRVDVVIDSGAEIHTGLLWSFVTLNPPVDCPSADMDMDCLVSFEDMQILANQWLDCTVDCLADLDDSDTVNLPDYAVLSENWFDKIGPVVISEFMALNTMILDGDGASSDWLELCNISGIAVDIGGYYLTDNKDNLTKWRIPDGTTLDPKKYLLVFASGKTTYPYIDGNGYYHTNFNLAGDGEYLALVYSDGETILSEYADYEFDNDEFGYVPQYTNISYGFYESQKRFFSFATPAADNDGIFPGYVADTKFSHDRGYYDAPINLVITTDTPGAEIYYNTSGDEPTYPPTGETQLYTAPIPIASTSFIRAFARKPGYGPTNVDTQTYIFPEDIVSQTDQAPAWAHWDTEVDQDLVGIGELYRNDFLEGLESIPTVSLVFNYDDIFGTSGIYTNPYSVTEHATSFEYFDPATGDDFQINAGLKIHGGISRILADPKHGLRIVFRGEYGPTKLDHPLFESSDVERFDTLVLRCGSGDVWTWPAGGPDLGPYATYYNDHWARYTHLAMGYPAPHSKFVQVYLNGLYWGIYNIAERPDNSFDAEYRGGDKVYWDVMHDNAVQNGTRTAWDQMKALADAGLDKEANYNAFADEYLDLTAFADYMILNAFAGTWDWPHHNWWAAKNSADPDSKFMFLMWDTEQILEHQAIPYGWPGCGTVNCNIHELLPMVNPAGVGWGTGEHSPGYLYLKLRDNSKFRWLVGDRVHRYLFNDGALTTEPVKQRYEGLRDHLMPAIVNESARWGDSYEYTTGMASSGRVYTRDDHWLPNINTVINNYFPLRTDIVIGQFRQANLYPDINAPIFNVNASYQHGGQVSDSDLIGITNPDGNGTIYYTMDGSDIDLHPDVLVEIGAAKKVLLPTISNPSGSAWRTDPSFDDSSWNDHTYTHISGRRGAIGYERGSGYQSYISYDVSNMYDNTGTCYIRIPFSLTSQALNDITSLILKVMYDDAFVAYINGHEVTRTSLVPATPAWNSEATGYRPADPANFDRFDISAFIQYLNVGNNILAVHGLNGPKTSSDFLISVELVSEKPVSGPSVLEYTSPFTLDKSATLKSRILYDNEWSALNEADFAVGDIAGNFKITEIMYHPADVGGVDLSTEFVELKNIGNSTLNLNSVKFTDGIDFTFGDTTIAPGEYIVVVENINAFETHYGQGVVTIAGQYNGRLDNGGEIITLTDSIGQIVNSFEYKDSWFDITDGDGFSLTLIDPCNTDPNNWTKKEFWRPSAVVGGSPGENDDNLVPNPGDIVINEVLAHSDALLYDWIELHNTADQAINIGDWFLSDSAASDPCRMRY